MVISCHIDSMMSSAGEWILMTTPEVSTAPQAARRSHSPTPEQILLSGIAKTVFRLNGQLLSIAEDLAGPAGLTAARWQVLATVLREPMSVADISRSVGKTRQSVQRIADLLVFEELAEYSRNPAHRRAKLLSSTDQGRSAVQAIAPAHADLARRLPLAFGTIELSSLLNALIELSDAFEEI